MDLENSEFSENTHIFHIRAAAKLDYDKYLKFYHSRSCDSIAHITCEEAVHALAIPQMSITGYSYNKIFSSHIGKGICAWSFSDIE